MNQIYKVIWNKARNAYIVVSEFAKGYARSTTRSRVTRSTAILRLAVLLACTTSAITVGAPLGVQAAATVDAGTASGTNALAVGSTSIANGEEAVAIGSSQATADYTIAIGDDAVAMSSGEIAIGKGAGNAADNRTNDDNAISIGTSARSRGAGGVALGNQAYSNLAKAVAIGDSATANGEDSVAIGSGAVANTIDGVAIGSNSSVGRAVGTAGGPRWNTSSDIGGRWYTWTATKNATKGTDGTWTTSIDTASGVWQSTLGAVSIGTDGLTGTTYTRQLTGLAAGTQDTDAVNVAQWKNTMLATIGDAKEDSSNTRYGSDGVARNVTRLVDEYLTLTGAADDGTTLTKDDLTTDANIGTIVGDNKITFRLSKNLTGLDSVTTGNTVMNSTGLTITNTDDNTKNITLNGTNGNAVIGGVTVGYAADGALKYIDALSGKAVNDAPEGTYVYGLSNTQWDGTTYVSGRAATEDQLYYLGNKAEQDINSLANQIGDGTFGLIADDGYSVQTNLGSQITVKGDGKNITTKTNDGALEIDLSNNLDLGNAGSVQMGNTTINNSGVTITHTDTDGNSNNVSLTENGLSNGGNAITNVGSGGTTETNAANIGDVKKLATTVTGGTNTTVTSTTNSNGGTEYQVDLKNKVTLGSDSAKQVVLDGDSGLVKAGTNITLDGVNSHAYIGGVNVGHTAAGALSYRDASGNVVTDQTVPEGNYVYSLDNTTWDGSHYVSGRAATEDQLHAVESNVNQKIDNINTAIETVDKHHTEVTVNGGTAPASDGTYTDGNLQIAQTTGTDGQKIYDLKLSDNLSIGGAGQNGQDGSNGHMDIKGADGTSGVSLDGQDGISIKGSDGNSSVTISGKDGVDGVNGAEGHIGLNGKDGVTDIWTTAGTPGLNGGDGETMTRIVYQNQNGDIHEAATLDDGLKFGGDFGTASAVKLNKQVNVKGNAKNEADLTDGNIGVVSSQDDENGQLLIKLNKDLNLGDTGSVNMGNTVINNDGVTITHTDTDGKSNNVSLTESGLSNGGNKITNIAAGKVSSDSTDAVNGSQLYEVQTLAGQHTTVKAGSENISVTEGTNTATGGKEYTVDLANDVTFGSGANQIAINGSGGTVTVGTGDNQVKLDGTDGSVTAGNVTINGGGSGTIDGLTNTTWTEGTFTSGRAATEDQLHAVESNVNQKIDNINTAIETVDKHHTEVTVNGGTAPASDGTYIDGNLQIAQTTGTDGQKIYDLKLSDNLSIGGAGQNGQDGSNGHMDIKGADGTSGVSLDGQDGISIKGSDGNSSVTISGKDGVDGVNGAEGHIGLNGKDGVTDIWTTAGTPGLNGQDGETMTRIVYQNQNGDTHEAATLDDGMKYSGDSGSAAVKLNNNVQVYGGATEYADGSNIGVVASQDGDNAQLQIKLAKDLTGINSIEATTINASTITGDTFQAGNTIVDNNGLTIKTSDADRTISITDGNVNMGGNTVSGVADGQVAPGSTDAVNGNQLWQRDQAINSLGGAVNKLDSRVNRVGAGAAALAALHPLDFDPDDKWDFAAGYGNYKDASAVAVGAYYRPNEDTMFSIGGSFGGGENMVNAGVSFKLGQGNHVSTSRVAMAKEIKDLRKEIEGLRSALADVAAGNRLDPTKTKLFPDIPQNHWAYNEIAQLYGNGIVQGYPDGNFGGDRMMTRYEFALMVYRQMQRGAALSDRIVNEFEPELERIRIDTITKDKDGNPVIQRVRVIKDRG